MYELVATSSNRTFVNSVNQSDFSQALKVVSQLLPIYACCPLDADKATGVVILRPHPRKIEEDTIDSNGQIPLLFDRCHDRGDKYPLICLSYSIAILIR